MAAPDLLDPKSATQNSKPRLSFSTKPTVLASREEIDTTINVMKWKTVSTIFLVVVLYLIIGATVFKALEQPHETNQRTTIVIQKQTFISQHSCVNTTELDELIEVKKCALALFLNRMMFMSYMDAVIPASWHSALIFVRNYWGW